MVLGYESSGIVSAIGIGVTSLQVGDKVAIEPGVPSRLVTNTKVVITIYVLTWFSLLLISQRLEELTLLVLYVNTTRALKISWSDCQMIFL